MKKAVLILTTALILNLTACDTDSNPADTTSDTTPVTTNGSLTETENETSNTEPEYTLIKKGDIHAILSDLSVSETRYYKVEDFELEFDFDEAFQNIYVNNQRISLPFAIGDLEGEWELEDGIIDGRGMVKSKNRYTDEYDSFNVRIDNERNITGVTFRPPLTMIPGTYEVTDDEPHSGVYNLKSGQTATFEDIISVLGTPSIIVASSNSIRIEYFGNNEEEISITIIDGVINNCRVTYK